MHARSSNSVILLPYHAQYHDKEFFRYFHSKDVIGVCQENENYVDIVKNRYGSITTISRKKFIEKYFVELI